MKLTRIVEITAILVQACIFC